MHVAALQFDIAWEDKGANHRLIEAMLRDADLPRGTFVLLPELGDTGFSFDLGKIVDGLTVPWAQGLARDLGVWIQAGHAERGADGMGRNCATILDPAGAVAGTYEKVHPFSYGRETQHFSGGGHLLLRRCGEAVTCPLICYDLRFPELWRLAAAEGAEVFAMGASWPCARQAHWRALLIARAIENQAYVVAANRIGSDPNLAYVGGSMIVSPAGEVLAEAADEPVVIRAEIDLDALRLWRGEFPALKDLRRDLLGTIGTDAEAAR